jgi:hypothetical protein
MNEFAIAAFKRAYFDIIDVIERRHKNGIYECDMRYG